MSLPEVLGEDPFSCLFRLQEPVCLPRLLAPSCIFKVSIPSSNLCLPFFLSASGIISLLTLILLPPSLKDPWVILFWAHPDNLNSTPHLKGLSLNHICQVPFALQGTMPTGLGEWDDDISAGVGEFSLCRPQARFVYIVSFNLIPHCLEDLGISST